jgi:hypothetical protein
MAFDSEFRENPVSGCISKGIEIMISKEHLQTMFTTALLTTAKMCCSLNVGSLQNSDVEIK